MNTQANPFSAAIICEIANDGKTYMLIQPFCYYTKGEANDEERVEYFSKYGKWLKRDEIILSLLGLSVMDLQTLASIALFLNMAKV